MANLHLVQLLLKRDGDGCFYCGLPVGSWPTVEHLLPKSATGTDHPHNLALAHESCNRLADSMAVVDKIRLRDEMRRRASNG